MSDQLTAAQLEQLTDKIACPYDDPEQAEALILLMDEITRLSLYEPLGIETITSIVKSHALYRIQSMSADWGKLESSLVQQLRADLVT